MSRDSLADCGVRSTCAGHGEGPSSPFLLWVPGAGVEPASSHEGGILSPLRLPISPSRPVSGVRAAWREAACASHGGTNNDALATGVARAQCLESVVFLEAARGVLHWTGAKRRRSGVGELEADFQAVRALEAR